MVSDKWFLKQGDPARDGGLIYLDATLVNQPATHALIIGAGRFSSAKLPALTSTAASARAIADWFLSSSGFNNTALPLGSLAVVLSDSADEPKARAVYRSVDVPPATMPETEKAIALWMSRLKSSKDNFAFFYIASHGQSIRGRSVFMLEDYGAKEWKITYGMSEMEQFVAALEMAVPRRQLLLFDCCRLANHDQFPWHETIADVLVSPRADASVADDPLNQWAIAATTRGQAAGGIVGAPSLFAESLLAALDGVAAELSLPGAPVRPGTLFERISTLLALHRLPGERQQRPNGGGSGGFDITFPVSSQTVTLYVSVSDPALWPGCKITVTDGGLVVKTHQGAADESPFISVPVGRLQSITADGIDAQGNPMGSRVVQALPPVQFIHLSPSAPVAPAPPVLVDTLGETHAIGGLAKIAVAIVSQHKATGGALVSILRQDDPARKPKTLVVPFGSTGEVEVLPGTYAVTLRTADGGSRQQLVTLNDRQVMQLTFNLGAATVPDVAPDMAPAAAGAEEEREPAATAPSPKSDSVLSPVSDALLKTMLDQVGKLVLHDKLTGGLLGGLLGQIIGGQTEAPLPSPPQALPAPEPEAEDEHAPVKVEVVGGINLRLRVKYGRWHREGVSSITMLPARAVGTQLHIQLAPSATPAAEPDAPFFARLDWNGRSELAVIPTLAASADIGALGWRPTLVVDTEAEETEAFTNVVVADEKWSAVLEFLQTRDFDAAGQVLDALLGTEKNPLVAALGTKAEALLDLAGVAIAKSGPLAAKAAKLLPRDTAFMAVAGALVAVASSDAARDRVWDSWLEPLAEWFPALPDGAIIYARRLMQTARGDAAQMAKARAWLLKGARRGVPVYSLATEWLARGLEACPGTDAELAKVRLAARGLANRVDSNRVFTVIDISAKGTP